MRRDVLVIRRSQLAALREPVLEAFLRRLAQHVAQVFPGHADFVGSRSGHRFLRQCIAQARPLGIADQHSVALYTDLCIALGLHFADDPRHGWIAELLQLRELDAAARLCLVYDQLPLRCPGPPLPPPAFGDDGDLGTAAPMPRALVPMWPERFWG